MNRAAPRLVQCGMKRFAIAFAPFALVTLAVVGLQAVQTEVERVSRTLPLAAGGTLHLKSFSGRVTITAADRQDVAIEAVRRATRERLDRIKLDIRGDGDDVYIEANRSTSRWRHNNVVETDFDISVPRRTNVDVTVFSAEVDVRGVDGAARVSGFSSKLRVENVTGAIKAHTFSGPVEVRAAEWRPDQNLDVDTFSGDVTLRVPESVRGTLSFNSFSGHLDSDLPMTRWEGGRRSIRASLGGGGSATLRLKTFSGSVQIDR